MSHHTLAQMVAAGTRLMAQRQLIWDLLHEVVVYATCASCAEHRDLAVGNE